MSAKLDVIIDLRGRPRPPVPKLPVAGVSLPPAGTDWVVIMQRFDGSLNFNRNWIDYRNGFGELGGQREFWLGNELISLLTSTAVYTLRIEVA